MNEIQTLENIENCMLCFFHSEKLMAIYTPNLVRLINLFYGISNKAEFYKRCHYLQEA